MSKFEKSMSEIFDVDVKVEQPVQEILPAVQEPTKFGTPARLEEDLDQDYEESRKTIKDLVNKGNQAIDHLLAIASESEHPRAFEVLSGLMKNLADMNKDLLEIQKRKKDLAPKAETQNNLSIDKAVFVGSTAELVKMLKTQKQET